MTDEKPENIKEENKEIVVSGLSMKQVRENISHNLNKDNNNLNLNKLVKIREGGFWLLYKDDVEDLLRRRIQRLEEENEKLAIQYSDEVRMFGDLQTDEDYIVNKGVIKELKSVLGEE